MTKIRVRREKFVQNYCPRDAPMVSAPICIRCLDFFANEFTLARKFEVVCSLMVNPNICGDVCHTDFISAKVRFQINARFWLDDSVTRSKQHHLVTIFENMSKTHLPCDPIYTDAECTRWADLMKMTEKMTDDGLDYNTTVTKIMDTIPNETIEENFIIIENITLPDT